MACITDREVELFSKRNELIDTLSEERASTADEESRIARHERDGKTTKLFHGKAEIENWRQQMGPQHWDSITPEGAKKGPQTQAADRFARARGRSLLRQVLRCVRPDTNGGDPETRLR